MKKLLLTFLLLVQVLCVAAAHANPVIPPKPAGADMYVQDYAEVIAPIDRARILDIGRELQDRTTAQVVVLTVKEPDKQPIETYSYAVLDAWNLGSRESHNGALLVISTKEKQSYIAVGNALKGALPNSLVYNIQTQNIHPFFDQGNYSKGIMQGYASIAGAVAKEAGIQLNNVTYNEEETSFFNLSSTETMLIGVGITVLLLIDNFLLGGIFAQMLLGLFLWERNKPDKKSKDTNNKEANTHK